MCSDLHSVSQACAYLSATGILFMSWVGVMLVKQPFFILGIANVEIAKSNAFGAAGLFFVLFVSCIAYLIRDAQQQHMRGGVPTSSVRSHDWFLSGQADYGQVPVTELPGGAYRDDDDGLRVAGGYSDDSVASSGGYSDNPNVTRRNVRRGYSDNPPATNATSTSTLHGNTEVGDLMVFT